MANEKENKNLTWPVVDYKGAKVGEVVLPGYLFNADINEVVVQRAVRVDLANRRVATACTLDRANVHGSNRKPYAQKGTGRARAGTTNSPLWRHGGVVHGPDGNQNFKLKMNKKEYAIAFSSVMSDKVKEKDLIVIDDKPFDSHKTKDLVEVLKALKADKKTLIITLNADENLSLAASNLQNVHVYGSDNCSVYDVLNADKLILSKGVIPTEEDETEEEAK
ncbi:MAG: 50S ribosomal protein L4 [Bacilli bacterium]